jgi:hypothetical protein
MGWMMNDWMWFEVTTAGLDGSAVLGEVLEMG